jgi:hypothetical protein
VGLVFLVELVAEGPLGQILDERDMGGLALADETQGMGGESEDRRGLLALGILEGIVDEGVEGPVRQGRNVDEVEAIHGIGSVGSGERSLRSGRLLP